jgi:hypothetical protein
MDRTERVGGGGMTGATGDLTPDETDRAFEPGERREVADPAHQADVTVAQARGAPAQQGETGEFGELPEGGPTNMASRDDGYGSHHGLSPDDPAYRMERRPTSTSPDTSDAPGGAAHIGGDDLSEGEERY